MKRSPTLSRAAAASPLEVAAPDTRSRSLLEEILAYGLVMTAGAAVGLTILVFALGYSATLFADSWTVLMDFQDSGYRFSLPSLVSFHNEHRPLFARIFILADYLWLGARGWLPFSVIFLTQAAQAWLLWKIAARQSWFSGGRYRKAIVSFAIFCCFSVVQQENFLWSFQTAYLLNFLFATLAIVGIVKQKESGLAKWSALVFTGILSAPLCLGSGAFVWLLAVVIALMVRLQGRWILAYGATGIAVLLAYLPGYTSSTISIAEALKMPLALAVYVGHFFGSTWRVWPIQLGELLALAAIGLLGFRCYQSIREAPANPWDAAPQGLMLFALGTGMLASLVRVNFGFKQAEMTRYQTPALLFWFGAVLIVLSILPRTTAGPRLIFESCLLAGTLASFAGAPLAVQNAITYGTKMDIAGAAWTSGIYDMDSLTPMIAHDQLGLYWPMREHHWGPFSVPPGSWLGTTLPASSIQTAEYCSGHFSRDGFFGAGTRWPGLRFHGRAQRTSDWTDIRHFVTTDSNQRILGLGVDGVAFAATGNKHERVIVYGLPEPGKACAIPTEP